MLLILLLLNLNMLIKIQNIVDADFKTVKQIYFSHTQRSSFTDLNSNVTLLNSATTGNPNLMMVFYI